MKQLFKVCAIGLFCLNFQSTNGTEMRIRAQDDVIEDGLKLSLSIPGIIQEGPKGNGIEIIAEGKLNAKFDQNGGFLDYINVDSKGNKIPTLTVEELQSKDGNWPPSKAIVNIISPNGRRKVEELVIYKSSRRLRTDYDGRAFYMPSDVSINHLPYPFFLLPNDPIPVEQLPFFDSVSAYGTVWNVLNMFGQVISTYFHDHIPELKAAKQRWNSKGTLYVFPHMTDEQFKKLYPEDRYDQYIENAFYDFREDDSRIKHVLCFFPVKFGEFHYTCQYFDIVSHEGGHFVLNILRPDLWHSKSPDRKAFHETFGDITALLAVLNFPELRRMVLKKTSGNLHISSFLSVIGEGIVDRDASLCTRLTETPSCEEHDLSEKLTHALYGIFADFYNNQRVNKQFEPIQDEMGIIFDKTINDFKLYFLTATVKSKLISFVDFGRTLRTSDNPLFNRLVHENFLRQQIDLTDHKLTPQLCLLPKKEEDNQHAIGGCSTGKVGMLPPRHQMNGMRYDQLLRFQRLSIEPGKG